MVNDFLFLRNDMEDVFESILKSFENMKLWIPERDEKIKDTSVKYGAEDPDWEKNREYVALVRTIWTECKKWKDKDPKKKLEKYIRKRRNNTLSYCESMVVEDFLKVIDQDQIKYSKI